MSTIPAATTPDTIRLVRKLSAEQVPAPLIAHTLGWDLPRLMRLGSNHGIHLITSVAANDAEAKSPTRHTSAVQKAAIARNSRMRDQDKDTPDPDRPISYVQGPSQRDVMTALLSSPEHRCSVMEIARITKLQRHQVIQTVSAIRAALDGSPMSIDTMERRDEHGRIREIIYKLVIN